MFDPVGAVRDRTTFEPVGAAVGARREALAAAQGLRSWVDAVEARWLGVWGAGGSGRVSSVPALASEVRDSTGVSAREARRRVNAGVGSGAFPAVVEALGESTVTREHLEAFTTATANHPGAAAALAAAQTELLAHAASEPADEFSRRVERFARSADAVGAEDRDAKRHARRHVKRFEDPETSMSIVRAELVPVAADEFWAALCHIARRLWRIHHPTPTSTSGAGGDDAPDDDAPDDVALSTSHRYRQLLADALVEMARLSINGTGTGSGGTAGVGSAVTSPNATVVVLIDHDTLVAGVHGATVAENGAGDPVPFETIRRLACEAGIIPAVLSGTGAVLDLGHRSRYATPAQRLALGVTWATCAYPGCATPAAFTHAHHIWPAEHGGPTDLDNLVPLCTIHHHLVHEGHVTVSQPERGHVIFTTPAGIVHHAYAVNPLHRNHGPGRRSGGGAGRGGGDAGARARPGEHARPGGAGDRSPPHTRAA